MRLGVYVSLQSGVGTPRAVHFSPERPVELTVGSGGAWRVALSNAVPPSTTADTQALLSFDGTHLKVRRLSGRVQVDGVVALAEVVLCVPCQLSVGDVVLSCDVTPPSHGNYIEAATFQELSAHTRAVPQFSPVKSFATTLLGFRTSNVWRAAAGANAEPTTTALVAHESNGLDAEALFANTRKLSPNDLALTRTRPDSLSQVTPQKTNTPGAAAGRTGSETPMPASPSAEPTGNISPAKRFSLPRNAISVALACAAAGAIGWTAARWSGSNATTPPSAVAAAAPSAIATPGQPIAASEPAANEPPSAPGVPIQGPNSQDGGTVIGREPAIAAEPLSASKPLVELEARAVEALASGKREQALSLYKQLEQMAPTFVVYAEVTQMLRDNQGIAASNP